MYAVEIESVVKTYGAQTAVDELSLQVPAGSVYGFIGPNGSGKSTTLRMIMRIIAPDRGHIRVLGVETSHAANDRIGYLPEERGLYKKMVVREILIYHSKLKGMSNPGPVVDEWLERLRIADAAKKRVEALSKGMAQKIQFIATVVANPELVILDEPFSGLDPVNMEVVRDAILDLRKTGATVIFSTHDMNVAERMCDFIFMIYKGKKVLDGSLNSIRDTYGTDTVKLRTSPGADVGQLQRLPGVTKVVDFGNVQEVRLERGADSQNILRYAVTRGAVELFEVAKPSLHDVFVRIAGEDVETTVHA
jgi:ABC-2 type transport system ATP-binding protein